MTQEPSASNGMSLAYKFRKAAQIIDALDPRERTALEAICGDIQRAQVRLLQQAQGVLRMCIEQCQGLCCRNVYPDDLITLADCVYVLVADPLRKQHLIQCLQHESMFSADCLFLENGVGPCLFPSDSRPEKCLITFCGDDRPVKPAIRVVRSHFSRLTRFIMWRKPRALKNRILGLCRTARESVDP